MIFHQDEFNTIYLGDVRDELNLISPAIVDAVITSPPYYGLRKYKAPDVIFDNHNDCQHEWGDSVVIKKTQPARDVSGGFSGRDLGTRGAQPSANAVAINSSASFCVHCSAWRGQLGLEPSPDLYIKHLCDIFDGVKRVMKKTGSLWVNIDDSYNSHSANSHNVGGFQGEQMRNNAAYDDSIIIGKKGLDIPDKSLIAVPARFQLEMIRRGWICRQVIIWHKNNPMPESVKDRFTSDFEYIYHFTIQGKYYFEQQFDEYTEPLNRWGGPETKETDESKGNEFGVLERPGRSRRPNRLGRNRRQVWTVNTHGYSGAHFATFPPKLVEPMILATCPEFICTKCGKPREKIYEVVGHQVTEGMRVAGSDAEGHYAGENQKEYGTSLAQAPSDTKRRILESMSEVKQYHYSDCGCGTSLKECLPGTVLDPFCGSGTTLMVATKFNRHSIGIDISPEYASLIKRRINGVQKNLVGIS